MAEKDEKPPEEPQPAVAWEPDKPAWKGSRSSNKPIVQPDGHESLTQEDIDARDS